MLSRWGWFIHTAVLPTFSGTATSTMISTEAQRPGGPIPVPHLPDDLTVAQFMLDAHHSCRSPRSFGVPWFIDDETGRKAGLEEVHMTSAMNNFQID